MERLRADIAGLGLAEIIAHLIPATGLEAYYRSERDGADRLSNLEELVNAATVFETEGDADAVSAAGGVINAFLAHASLEAGEHQAGDGRDALQLMTVHAAKGLEFQAVFITGLEEGLFPHEQSSCEHDGLEEERRLMYVAITRARRRLYLSCAESRMLHGQVRYGVLSRFLSEIPESLVRSVGARAGPVSVPLSAGAGSSPGAWHVGMAVVHPKFGQGIIVGCEGKGDDARVQVNFLSGTKWLAVAYANLASG
jgi:DNA helicase-2/ATP-dependent DNA helicase PcrA